MSERRRAEEMLARSEHRLRSLLDGVPQIAVYAHDAKGRVRYWNAASEQIYGYRKGEALGADVVGLLKPVEDSLGRIEAALSWALTTGDLPPAMELTLTRNDGKTIPVLSSLASVQGDDGIVELFRFDVDLTVVKDLEAQLFESQKMEAVGQLAGGIAHDFNNNLHAILGYAELSLLKSRSGQPVQDKLIEIVKIVERSSALVRQLLAYSRRQVLQLQDVDLNRLIPDLLAMQRRLLGEHIDVTFAPGPDVAVIKADPGQIGQILTNLCVNARDAMPEGGSVAISTAALEVDAAFQTSHAWARARRYAVLTVCDDGCGMAPSTLAHIFEPFFTTKDVGQGTGLGLSTVYGLVRQHGGMITAESEPGRGSVFRVFLPMTDRRAGDGPLSGPAPASPSGRETILLAEDEDVVRLPTKTVLEEAGYTVYAVGDGREAIEVFRAHAGRIAMVILDLVMPRLGGLAVYRQLVAEAEGVRFLLISGYSLEMSKAELGLAERLPLLRKPFSRGELLTRIRALLDQPVIPAAGE